MIRKLTVIAVLLIACVLLFAATRPDSFHVQRIATIAAPPAKVFGLIDDLHQWASWSPWERLDPAMKSTHSGAPRGKGAAYAWDGNDKVGQGRMEIVDSSSPSSVTLKLDFIKPFEGHDIAKFALLPAGDGTTVTWAMEGPQSFVVKLMGVFVSMDSVIGKDFETGLANLKAVAER
jgi:carbon monoxide dehydrogenase subunit G